MLFYQEFVIVPLTLNYPLQDNVSVMDTYQEILVFKSVHNTLMLRIVHVLVILDIDYSIMPVSLSLPMLLPILTHV